MSIVHDMNYKLHKNGIRIKPNPCKKKKKFAVMIEDDYNTIYKRKVTVGEYKHTTATINNALDEAIKWVYKRLINEI